MKYESVIGLEVHVELKTNTKIFCGCSTEFGAEPNTHVCPVCLGLPGSMPVLNKEVLHYAVKAGLALHCDILPYSKFDRKNYYYPDLPKNFQTSQYDLPICLNGYVDIEVGGETRRIRLTRIHMEEDAGKLVHSGASIDTSDTSFVDYNRTGVPLLEIVSEPDIRSGEEARAYLEKLRSIMQYLGVSDCRMEEGSMRCDANISIRPVGSTTLGTKTEIKNINSFSGVQKGIEYEAVRQAQILEDGGSIQQATRGWDEAKGVTVLQRVKEGEADYRYFPEPDLIPIEVSPEYIERVRTELPEMPDARCKRFQDALGLSDYDANLLTMENRRLTILKPSLLLVPMLRQQRTGCLVNSPRSSTKKVLPSIRRRFVRKAWQSLSALSPRERFLVRLPRRYFLKCGRVANLLPMSSRNKVWYRLPIRALSKKSSNLSSLQILSLLPITRLARRKPSASSSARS